MSDKHFSYYRTLYDVTRTINSSLDPATVLSKIVEQVALAMEAKGCTIRLLDRDGTVLRAGASYGLSKDYLRKGAVEVSKSTVDREALEGQVVTIEDVAGDPRFQYPREAGAEGIVSVVVIPLMVEGNRVIGVLRVYSSTRRTFTEEEIEFIQAIANISAIAIENARLHNALKSDYELLKAFEYRIFED